MTEARHPRDWACGAGPSSLYKRRIWPFVASAAKLICLLLADLLARQPSQAVGDAPAWLELFSSARARAHIGCRPEADERAPT